MPICPSSLSVVALLPLRPFPGYADAIFPTLILAWPITILLLAPVVVIESLYARSRLRVGFWRSVRVVGVANLLSAVAGLPLATAFSWELKYVLESIYFHDAAALKAKLDTMQVTGGPINGHSQSTLIWLGLYPRWIMLASAVTMMALCFFISWWVEGKWILRYVTRTDPDRAGQVWGVARDANLLSYVFLTTIFLLVLLFLWPRGMSQMYSRASSGQVITVAKSTYRNSTLRWWRQ